MADENNSEIDVDNEIDQTYSYSEERTLIAQGAEARLYKCVYLGREAVMKERFSKKYRHPELDRRLTKERIRNEFRAITKCKEIGIDVPTIYFLNTNTNAIIFEYIEGPTAKDYIEESRNSNEKESFEKNMRSLGYNIGMMIGKLHSERLSHGDLTTSNVILRSGDPDRVCLIDFGLSSCQSNIEDFGVDMYVLERAIRTTHVDMEFMMDAILNGYQAIGWKDAKAAVKKLDEVRLRGRNREMTG